MKQYPIIIIIILVFIFLFSYNWKHIGIVFKCSQYPETLNEEVQNVKTTTQQTIPPPKETLVLVWNWPWGTHFPLDRCETEFRITGCRLSIDRSLYSAADAVIMHYADIMNNKNLVPQQPRNPHQHWVWLNLEPPLIISNLNMWGNMFNLTMTFRHDSDIYIPYGYLEALKEPQNNTIPPKSKLVAWVVSKWYPGVPRITYYEELKKHISVDVYGARHMKLSREDFHSTLSQYKFYLAFENSIYLDYITEKLWLNAMGSGTVPVVLGTSRENYERYVPGDAFIHVDDFSNPKELAAYLLELDKDDEKYRKYFNWRSQYSVKLWKDWSYPYCKACQIIKDGGPRHQVIRSLENWFLKDIHYGF
ncbi:4-galactosyl-N-acetylglucosaminide 3-alpha-L-fucosyltransferase 9-like [Rhinoderma darwinii]|uniref:4-galactosyl-N-acetylglucosaminide 3-alpha-L-fucosyltransferase 9-like n=1 Tax=Rhinoderma darwinii TaxID=43563 RepID=UPI003F67A2F6